MKNEIKLNTEATEVTEVTAVTNVIEVTDTLSEETAPDTVTATAAVITPKDDTVVRLPVITKMSEIDSDDDGDSVDKPKRGRGRPRNDEVLVGNSNNVTEPKRSRGRPREVVSDVVADKSDGIKRGRGRPRKVIQEELTESKTIVSTESTESTKDSNNSLSNNLSKPSELVKKDEVKVSVRDLDKNRHQGTTREVGVIDVSRTNSGGSG